MQPHFTTPGKAVLPRWENRNRYMGNFAGRQAETGFLYATEDRILIDERAGGKIYKITLPENAPAKGWHAILGLYGPIKSFYDKTWNPGDPELVES